MLLAIDIGNTNVVTGIYQEGKWLHIWRFETLVDGLMANYELALSNCLLEKSLSRTEIKSVVLSSVVPPLNSTFSKLSQRMFSVEPLILGPDLYPNLEIDINNPEEIGSDLVANAVAAYDMLHENCIVVDFGTALTFTAISAQGRILGVSIAPGLRTAIKSLYESTAKLPEVPLEVPSSVLGQDTIHAMQAGILIGFSGLVEVLISRIKEEVGRDCKVIATGGLASVLDPDHKQFDVVQPSLTLDGLRIVQQTLQ